MSKLVYHKTVLAGLLLLLLSWGGNLRAQNTPIGFSIPDVNITEKDTFTISLNADSILTGKSVYAYRFYLTYSPGYFEFLELDGVGPVLSSWGTPTLNSSNEGTLIMAGAGTTPLTVSGEMIYLRFRSKRSGNAYISFSSTESYLNERNPASVFTNGYIIAAARSYPNISPDQQQLFIGDEVQMSVTGGEAPYIYSVENPAVAVVNDVNKIKATGPGTTRIFVTDGNGEVSYTTGLFDVRVIKMNLEEVSAWPDDTFYIPVKIEVSPGTSIYSGRFDLSYDSGISGISGDIQSGDFPLMIESNATSNRISVSFASSTGITNNGILCYLAFKANTSGSRKVQFENMKFNESLLAWPTKSSYYITVNSLPLLSFSPNSGTLMWGEVIKINVSNGTAPYTYSVSNPSLASIDAQGNLTAISGGQVSITTTDAHGAAKTSGLFTIADNKLTINPTDGVLDEETKVPVISSSLPSGKAIYGFKSTITFDDTHLDFIRVDPPNDGTLVQSTLSGNSIQLAGASGEGITSGVIGFIVFKIKNTLPLDDRADVFFTSFSANENTLHSILVNGNIHRVEQVSYRPIANAGQDFSIQEGNTGYLDGTGSYDNDGDPLNYLWRAPDGFVLTDSTSPAPQFTAPYVTKNTIFTITLVVNDGNAESDPSEINITVLQINNMPVADAGEDISYMEGSSVSLDGVSSFDPDGDAISFQWTSLDGIILFNSTSKTPSFILPQVSINTSYRFVLLVNDGALNSLHDTVSITAIQLNKKPVAFAGGDFSLQEKEQGSLDGSLSYDNENEPLSYLWTPPPGVALSSNDIANPTFTAPSVHRDSVLSFILMVNDGTKNSEPDEVLVSIINIDSLSKEAMIENVIMTGLDSFLIDTTNSLVKLYVPYGSDIQSLAPEFILSQLASIAPSGGGIHDFTTPVYYFVTAEDGITNRLWKVEIFRPQIVVQRQLNSGWNWVSLNVQPTDMRINSLFSDLSLSDLDYVKSTEYSSTYYAETGWFGNLSSFPENQMVKFRKNTTENLLVQGLEINPAITPIPLVPGWNSIAYLLKSNTAINSAIEISSIPPGDVVLKGHSGSAVYYTGSGWAGELDTLKILYGYKLNVKSSGCLKYDPSGVSQKNLSSSKYNRRQLLQDYQLKPGDYEYSATLIAEAISKDGVNCLQSGDLIIAYHENECRGISEAKYIPVLDKYVFILTYFSNTGNEGITFKIKSYMDGTENESDLYLAFQSDNITGEAYLPYKITLDVLSSTNENLSDSKLYIYPNPVKNQLTIIASGLIEKITLFDLTGKRILNKIQKEKTFIIPMQKFAPGIYTLKLETEKEIILRKIVKTSY